MLNNDDNAREVKDKIWGSLKDNPLKTADLIFSLVLGFFFSFD